jgi:hypothetical protein
VCERVATCVKEWQAAGANRNRTLQLLETYVVLKARGVDRTGHMDESPKARAIAHLLTVLTLPLGPSRVPEDDDGCD